jgi:endoglucanase
VRWRWFDFITRAAKSFNYPLILWDSGADDFNCPVNTWNDPVTLDVWFNAATRINNTLADSTTDQQATSQITSTSIFHKVGEVVYPQSVTYLMDGNTLTSVKTPTGTALNSS